MIEDALNTFVQTYLYENPHNRKQPPILFQDNLCQAFQDIVLVFTRIWGVLVLGVVWFVVGGAPWYNFWFTLGAWAAVCQGEASDRFLGRIRCSVPADAAAWCFFIYLYHYIPVITAKKLLGSALDPHSFAALLGTYLATALLTLGLLTGAYILLKKIFPRLTGVLVGGKL